MKTYRAVLCAIMCAVFCTAVRAAKQPDATVTGTVYLDVNNNGKRDSSEKGLEGIRVTDGVNFVVTDAKGAYSIQIADDPVNWHREAQTVSVCWPSGKWPSGTWWKRLSEVGKDKRVNFGLKADEQKLPVSFVFIADGHNNGAWLTNRKSFKKMVGLAKGFRFFVNGGDLMYVNYDKETAKSVATYDAYMKNRSQFKYPMFHCAGNHDLSGVQGGGDKNDPLYGNGIFTKYLGPVRFSFNVGNAHVVIIDWADWDAAGKYVMQVPPCAADWLDRDLSDMGKGKPTVIFAHYPSGEKFWQVAMKHKVELMVGGHSHRYLWEQHQGVRYMTTKNPCGFSVFTLLKEGVEVRHDCLGCKGPGSGYHNKHCFYRKSGAEQTVLVRTRQ